ncbi:hypothetical protein PV10_01672 [Exophiala mesophila]|uniref:Class II aldolase/adducin N-terminal domain-containing protein n=1 Tax=Exophiala mesophila TaxID=212818 RepID=A0A0D1ZTW2_EXOME|nr:uncharacterized protein PV10_01672 [Exophiala mesophila]KIV97977.1 hypothetical protein PV10_01672 [Exophiala mesophila]
MSKLDEVIQDLIHANHIMHYNGVVDAFGHISVRHPHKPDVMIMSANMAPALVRTGDDFVEYRIEDAQPVAKEGARGGFIERYIHSELFKKYPDINSVIHCHAQDVLPYAVSGVPFKPFGHTNGFLGQSLLSPPQEINLISMFSDLMTVTDSHQHQDKKHLSTTSKNAIDQATHTTSS